MILFPNAKINLGLNVIQKRPDGYHDLETVFYPIALRDALEIIEEEKGTEGVCISFSGISITGKAEDNLCVKAYSLLKKDHPQLPAVTMHLHKIIPASAGLGGGSADGASTLKLLNEKFDLKLSTEQLIRYALQLGSDCPFFIINKSCFATGRGEFLEPVSVDLARYKLAIINPGIHVGTSEAFSLINPAPSSKSIKEIVQQPVETWKTELKNDFEDPIFKKHPELENIKTKLYDSGAVYASMTGSGSTIYGIFRSNTQLKVDFPSAYLVKELIC